METNKVPTAEEFGNSMYQLGTESCKEFAIRMAKEFAKLHIKAAYTKAFSEGIVFGMHTEYKYKTSEEYIANLKLDM